MVKKRGEGISLNLGKVQINLTNRWLYTLIALGIFAIIGVGIYAANFIGPNGVGHDLSEIEPCADGQILQMIEGVWSCFDMPEASADTNAGTICSGANQFLAGDGTCKTGYLDADGADTHGSLECRTLTTILPKDCDTRCSGMGYLCVGAALAGGSGPIGCAVPSWNNGKSFSVGPPYNLGECLAYSSQSCAQQAKENIAGIAPIPNSGIPPHNLWAACATKTYGNISIQL